MPWNSHYEWTDERIVQLKHLRLIERQSYTACAISLFGTAAARCAVAGKLGRMEWGLTPEQRLTQSSGGRAPGPQRRSAKVKVKAAAPPPPSSPQGFCPQPVKLQPIRLQQAPNASFRCTLLELQTDSCRWPVGDPERKSFRYCGTPGAALPGPYCTFCHAMAYNPSKVDPELRAALAA